MAMDIGLWKIVEGKKLMRVNESTLSTARYKEGAHLENWLCADISLINEDFLVIGRQVITSYNHNEIDLLCIDGEGNIIIIELKREKTPRDVVAQILDYASWVNELSPDMVYKIADDFADKHLKEKDGDKTLQARFKEFFEVDLQPEDINKKHKMLIVASEMDDQTERILRYLSETHGVDINFVRFQFLKDDDNELLARVFLIDPNELERAVDRNAPSKRSTSIANARQLFDAGIATPDDVFIFQDKDGKKHEHIVCKLRERQGPAAAFKVGIDSIKGHDTIDIYNGNNVKESYSEFPIEETTKKCSLSLHKLLGINDISWSDCGDKNFVRISDGRTLADLRREYNVSRTNLR